MKRILPYRREVLPKWQCWVCILLIGLVLYNPFAGLFNSNDSLCYDRMARNRATVGASELQHFSPVTNPIAQSELDADVPASALVQMVREEYPSVKLQEVFPPHFDYISQHGNRPPPSL